MGWIPRYLCTLGYEIAKCCYCCWMKKEGKERKKVSGKDGGYVYKLLREPSSNPPRSTGGTNLLSEIGHLDG